MIRLARIPLALLPLALLALAFWALAPAMSGGFLFDDYVNLPTLGEYGGVRDAYTLALYLTSGLGDPTGRPLSMLSFLIDANNWPASPQPFLRTNIALHLLNGVLLAGVLYRMGQARQLAPRHAYLAGLLGAAIWLLHPLFLSTTSYIVQREAMLPATFVLTGMLLWLGGRKRLLHGRSASGYCLLAAGSIGCTILAVLCKPNGMLLPLLLLVTEGTILTGSALPTDARLARARKLLLGVPAALMIFALLWMLPGWIDSANATRPWTLAQRLLTEPRALLDYLRLLALPRPIARGVFHDEFLVSTDWVHPAFTLPALALVGAIVFTAWRLRRSWPVAAFAVLFFFVGHLLESSVIPLELYFEHRNYLPAMMLFWPLALWLTAPVPQLRNVRLTAAALVLAALAMDTHIGSSIWGQPEQLAFAWAASNPDSPRAQAYAAQYEIADGAPKAAQQRLSAALAGHPEQTQLAFNLANAQCALGGLPATTVAAIRHAIAQDANAARLDFAWLRDAVERARAGSCNGLDLSAVDAFVQAARANPRFADAPGRQQDFEHLLGLIALARGDADAALTAFNRAADALPKPEIVLTQAALLGGAARPDLGLRHLDGFLAAHPLQPAHFGPRPAQLHAWLLDHYGYWRGEIERMRGLLAEARREPENVDHSGAPPPSPALHDG